MPENILLIGSNGQIGTELVSELRKIYGPNHVVACDIRRPDYETKHARPFEFVNVLDKDDLKSVYKKYKPSQVYILAALLSATDEQNPKLAWNLNMEWLA